MSNDMHIYYYILLKLMIVLIHIAFTHLDLLFIKIAISMALPSANTMSMVN